MLLTILYNSKVKINNKDIALKVVNRFLVILVKELD
jgi:hypothetical protein